MQDVKTQLPIDIEGIFIELNVRSKKWLLFCGYNPRKELKTIFLDNVKIHIDTFMGNYDNLILIEDFISEMEEEKVKDFCDIYKLTKSH